MYQKKKKKKYKRIFRTKNRDLEPTIKNRTFRGVFRALSKTADPKYRIFNPFMHGGNIKISHT